MVTRLAAPMASSSGANDPGAPAKSAPEVVENGNQAWRLGAVADGPRRARVVARQLGDPEHQVWPFTADGSTSTTEVVLLALTDGVDRLRQIGATSVTIVVNDPTLHGYVWRRWTVHSLRVHSALTAFDKATLGIVVNLEPARKFRRLTP